MRQFSLSMHVVWCLRSTKVSYTWVGRSKNEKISLVNQWVGRLGSVARMREMIEYLRGGRIPRSKYPRTTLDQFTLEDDILYLCKRKVDSTILYLLAVPQDLKKAALKRIHEKESGHLGQHKTILKAEEYFYWPDLKQDVRKYVKECITCQQFKSTSGLQQPWQELPPVNRPMERLSMDITDMGSGALGHRYVLR